MQWQKQALVDLGTIFLPEACCMGNPNCAPSQYQAPNTKLYTFEDDGGYHFPGVIHHELNHYGATGRGQGDDQVHLLRG